MTDEGGFSVWGAGEPGVGTSSFGPIQSGPSTTKEAKRTSNLFDDLEEANADWSVDASPPKETGMEKAQSVGRADSKNFGSDPFPSSSSPKGTKLAKEEELEEEENNAADVNELKDQLESTGFDDDDFGEESFAAGDGKMDDDDFGDFGDFDKAGQDAFESEIAPQSTVETEADRSSWKPLSIKKSTDPSTLEAQIRDILAPPLPNGRMYPFHDGAASQLSQDKIRQVEGEAQVLVREESRTVWQSLTAQPDLRPVDWTRSSTRRQHLIALGIPINLDEVRVGDASSIKQLAPVPINLDKRSTDSVAKTPISRSGTPDGGREAAKAPEMDIDRAKELTSLTEDQLTLLALPALRDIAREMDVLTRQASALLTYHLSQREAHNADSEMYNGLIRDLVTGAANRIGSTAGAKKSGTLRKASAATGGRSSPSPAPNTR